MTFKLESYGNEAILHHKLGAMIHTPVEAGRNTRSVADDSNSAL